MVRNLITEKKLKELLKNWFWKLDEEEGEKKNKKYSRAAKKDFKYVYKSNAYK